MPRSLRKTFFFLHLNVLIIIEKRQEYLIFGTNLNNYIIVKHYYSKHRGEAKMNIITPNNNDEYNDSYF